jgi:hypothetical protein
MPSDSLFAWSGGYVVFRETEDMSDGKSDGQITITPWVSRDGSSWQKGQPLDVTGFWDTTGIASLIEGPGGLMAVSDGPYSNDDDSVDVPHAVAGLWTSTDGKAWKRVNLAKAFGVQALGYVAAGPGGYIACGLSDAPAVWLSSDGIKWRSATLAKGSLAGAHLGSAYVVQGGYLLAGWTGTPAVDASDTPPATTPAIWSSHDGVSWSEATLPGVVASSTKQAFVTTIALGHYTAAVETWSCGCETTRDDQTWSSTDGSDWRTAPPGSWDGPVVSDGHQGFRMVTYGGSLDNVESSPDGLVWSRLAVSGSGPADDLSAACGPLGLMVEAENGTFWLLAKG